MEINNLKKVYVASSIDLVNPSFLEIIKIGRELGEVTVGLLTDKAIASYKNLPLLTYEQRKEMIENIIGIKNVIPQETLDYEENLRKIKPNYVVHLAEWKTSLQREKK